MFIKIVVPNDLTLCVCYRNRVAQRNKVVPRELKWFHVEAKARAMIGIIKRSVLSKNLESSDFTPNCSISNINYIYKRDGLTYF